MSNVADIALPPRGFPDSEFEARTASLQLKMHEAKCDAVILTTEPNVRFYSGFFTQFWQSPTRPWFLVVPAAGKPIAVIPEIGHSGMAEAWIDDIRSWPSPRPEDDGISLLIEVVASLPKRFGQIGMTLGPESHLRMPVNNYQSLRDELADRLSFSIVDVADVLHNQRMVKSELEIEKTRAICRIASAGFSELSTFASAGMTERQICRELQMDLMRRGADTCVYMVAGSGSGGYDSIIMGPTDRELTPGDIMIIDTGSTYDGYFCDFDRNWAFGHADDLSRRAYDTVWRATEAGFTAARPGARACDLWQAMQQVMVEGGSLGNAVGRLGHGLGIELTERPSNTESDTTELLPGMIMTLEPGMTYAPGKQMVHEENIVITEDGAEWLSVRAAPELPVIS